SAAAAREDGVAGRTGAERIRLGERRRVAPGYSSWNEVRGAREETAPKHSRSAAPPHRRHEVPSSPVREMIAPHSGASHLRSEFHTSSIYGQPSRRRDQPVPPAARTQPGGLVAVDRGGAGEGAR